MKEHLPEEENEESWEHDDRRSDQPVCFHCSGPTAGEQCGFCGNELCPMCWEMGGGFCAAKHTCQQIDDYEDEAYPPTSEHEKQQRARQRKARDELKQLGIL